MSKRRHLKPTRQTPVFVTIPKLIESEDYSTIVVILFLITMGLLIFTFPRYIFAGLSFDFFLLVAWQLYSGVGLKNSGWNRKIIATHTKEHEPALFYRNLGIWVVAGVVTFLMFLGMYFLMA